MLTFGLQRRNHIALVVCPTEELGEDLDGLAPSQEIVERHPGDTGHFNVVNEAH